jgi:hypothetical protein
MQRSAWPCLTASVLFLLVTTPVLASTPLMMSPGAAFPGSQTTFVIHTPGASWSPAVQVFLGSQVSVTDIRLLSSEILVVTADISPTAVIGPRDVSIVDGEAVVHAIDAWRVLFPAPIGVPGPPTAANAIVNPGFENGNLNGWIPVTWVISNVLPHGGSWDAHDSGGSGGGGQCLRQNFNPPLDSNLITGFQFWLRQPDDLGIAQVIVFHQNTGVSVGVAFTNDDDSWTFENFGGLVRPNDFVTGIHVCGFGGGQPTADDSWADDFALDYAGSTAVEPATWGAIKATFTSE